MAGAQADGVRRYRSGLAAIAGASVLTLAVLGPTPAGSFGLGSTADVNKALEGARKKLERPNVDSGERDQAEGTAPAQASGPQQPDAASAPPAAPVQAAAPALKVQAAAPAAAPAPDYYAERAKNVLAAEKKREIKLHPLQAAAPDYDITLCEAGCQLPGLQVLSKRPKAEAVSATDPGRVGKSAALTPVAECVGGCSDQRHDDTGYMLRSEPAPRVMGAAAGNWMTSVSPAAPKAAAVKVSPAQASPVQASPAAAPKQTTEAAPDKPVAPDATAAPVASKPAAKADSSEDWMARINRERAEKKSQAGM